MHQQAESHSNKPLSKLVAKSAFRFDSMIAPNENSVFSPLSLYRLLLVLTAGSKGQTRELLEDLTSIKDDEYPMRSLAAQFNKLVKQLMLQNNLTDEELPRVVSASIEYEEMLWSELARW